MAHSEKPALLWWPRTLSMCAFYLGRCFFTQSFRQSRIPLKANRPVLIEDYVWKWKIRSDRRTAKVGNLAKGQSRLRSWWLGPSVSRLMHWVLASYSPLLRLPSGRGRSASHPWFEGLGLQNGCAILKELWVAAQLQHVPPRLQGSSLGDSQDKDLRPSS